MTGKRLTMSDFITVNDWSFTSSNQRRSCTYANLMAVQPDAWVIGMSFFWFPSLLLHRAFITTNLHTSRLIYEVSEGKAVSFWCPFQFNTDTGLMLPSYSFPFLCPNISENRRCYFSPEEKIRFEGPMCIRKILDRPPVRPSMVWALFPSPPFQNVHQHQLFSHRPSNELNGAIPRVVGRVYK